MNGAFRMALAAAGVALLAGCSGMELQKAESMSPQGSSHDRSLYDGYLALSEGEYKEGDYSDSDAFAMKAMDAGSGKAVQPDMIASRELPADKVQELTAARLRLMTAMSAGAAEAKPLEAADAQIAFDCWMQEQEENFQPADIAACRDDFMMAMTKLEERPKVAAAPPPPPAPMMAEPQAFTVHFDFDDSGLTPDARAMLADVVNAAKKDDYQTIDISGYTDLVGADAYNQVLSEQRANSVINFLVDSGIEAGKIVGRGLGKADPVVDVQKPEMANRRVEIRLEP
ncbi:OmpA family protein [Pelagibius sp. CAU 1746]|uniref:OmpA family protein n=1 Tax=Pelagibius sp. CAU 1746 TaxID=3140370 RepID=UPI00325ACD80